MRSVRPVNRIYSPAGLAPMMGRAEFPSRRRDHGEGSTRGGGLGRLDRRVAGQRPELASLLRAAWAQPRHDAGVGYKRGHRLAVEQARREAHAGRALDEQTPTPTFLPVRLAEPIPIEASGPGVEVVLG